MDIIKTFDRAVNYAVSNPFIAGIAGVILLVLLIKKPKLTLGVIAIVLFATGVMHLISRLFESAIFE